MDPLTMLAGIPGVAPLLPVITTVIAVCAAIAVVVPPPAAGVSGLYPALYKALNFIALNFGHARNAASPAPDAVPPPVGKI